MVSISSEYPEMRKARGDFKMISRRILYCLDPVDYLSKYGLSVSDQGRSEKRPVRETNDGLVKKGFGCIACAITLGLVGLFGIGEE